MTTVKEAPAHIGFVDAPCVSALFDLLFQSNTTELEDTEGYNRQ